MVAARTLQEMERLAAASEVVLGVDLDEADFGSSLEELDAMLGAQADAGAQGRGRTRPRGR